MSNEKAERRKLGEEIAAYYKRDDLPLPDDDETARPSPLKAAPDVFVEPLSREEREEITAIGDKYEKEFVRPNVEKVDNDQT